MNIRTVVAVAMLVPLIGLSACGGDDDAASSDDSTSSALDGTYGMEVTDEDGTPDGGASPGPWRLIIGPGLRARFDGPNGAPFDLSPTELTSTRMVVPPDPNCPNNVPAAGEGVYEVSLDGDSLTFVEVSDPCGDRAFTLTVHEWQREG